MAQLLPVGEYILDNITRRLKVNGYKAVKYPVYTSSEADADGIFFKYWQDCDNGDFGCSDDGYVGECISRKSYKNGTEVSMSYGKMWIGSHRKLLYEPRRVSGNFATVSHKTFEEVEGKSDRAKRAVNVYTMMMLSGSPIDWEMIGKIYRKDQKRPDLTAKRLFKQEVIKHMVDERIDKALKERDMGEGAVLDVIDEAIQLARKKEDPATMLRGAENLIRIVDMLPKRAVQTDTMQIDVTNEIMDQVESHNESIRLEQKKELSVNGK